MLGREVERRFPAMGGSRGMEVGREQLSDRGLSKKIKKRAIR